MPDRRNAPSGVPASTDVSGTYDLVLVGGVPGAGKTTAIARATDDLAHVVAIDPEHVSWWLRRRLPAGATYRSYRWLVHLGHTLRVLAHLVGGPVAGRRLVVHDPGTRAGRRRLFLGLARLAGWRTVLLYVDVDRPDARAGQLRRGRVVRSFDEHWQSWQRLRPALMASPDPAGGAHRDHRGDQAVQVRANDELVVLTDRAEAAQVLRRLCLAA
jgi:hypothetical protein